MFEMKDCMCPYCNSQQTVTGNNNDLKIICINCKNFFSINYSSGIDIVHNHSIDSMFFKI